jgi:3-oxoacyl-[acyl-carrier protein] reductase
VSKIRALSNGAAAISIQADTTSLESPKKIVDQTLAAFGPSIDILVNNAGVECSKDLLDITPADYEKTTNTNVRGVIFTTQAVVPHLRAPGRIINIGSVLSRIGLPGTSVYAATKAAVESLTRAWAAELGATGHTVNAISPGLTETDMFTAVAEAQGPAFEQKLQFQKMLTPLEHRIATVDDISLVAVMLAEPNSRWITGQAIQASGGIYMN